MHWAFEITFPSRSPQKITWLIWPWPQAPEHPRPLHIGGLTNTPTLLLPLPPSHPSWPPVPHPRKSQELVTINEEELRKIKN